MKIAILYDRYDGYEEYPGASAAPESTRRRRRGKRPKTDREAIADALRELGHEPVLIAIDGRIQTLTKIARSNSELFFNLTESYAGDDTKEMHFAAYLDLLGKRYTGAGPQALYLAMDKAVAKKIIRFHDLYTPYSAVVYKGRVEHAQDIRFPIIVKPASEDASKGIDTGGQLDQGADGAHSVRA